MNPHQLAPEAEGIRKKIKEMIPEIAMDQNGDVAKASILSEDKDGNKTYGGLLLTEQISLLTEHMKIGEVFQSQHSKTAIIANQKLGLGVESCSFFETEASYK